MAWPSPPLAARLIRADANAATDAWIRGVGYHESVAGSLDASQLDAWVPEDVRAGLLSLLEHDPDKRMGLRAASAVLGGRLIMGALDHTACAL